MKILYVTYLHPFQKEYGAGIRNASIIEGLKKGHDLHVVHFVDGPIPNGLTDTWKKSGIDHIYLLQNKNSCSSLSLSHKSLEPYPLNQVESFRMVVKQINPDVLWYFGKKSVRRVGLTSLVPKVVDLIDVHWHFVVRNCKFLHGTQKFVKLMKVIPIWFEDHWIASRANVLVFANAEETRYINGRKTIISIPNSFEFPDSLKIEARKRKRLIFFGLLSYFPNEDGIIWFIQEIWPRIHAVCPETQIDIVGSYAPGFIEKLGTIPNVTIHGLLPNLDTLIAEASILVVPLRLGGGTRIKILEAWSKGLPVVSTSVGIEGLGAQNNKNALIADTPKDFASECIKLLNHPELGISLAEYGFQYGKANYSWESIYPIIEQALQKSQSKERRLF